LEGGFSQLKISGSEVRVLLGPPFSLFYQHLRATISRLFWRWNFVGDDRELKKEAKLVLESLKESAEDPAKSEVSELSHA